MNQPIQPARASIASQQSPPAAPRPGWFLVVNSLVVIGISIFLVSFAISSFNMAGSESVLAGLLALPLAVLVGLLEYLACFRRGIIAARLLRWLYAVAFVVLVLVLVAARCGLPAGLDGESPRDAAATFLLIPVVLVFVTAGGCSHIHWSQRLEAWQIEYEGADLGQERRPLQFSVAEMLGAMVLVALIAGLASWMIHSRLFR